VHYKGSQDLPRGAKMRSVLYYYNGIEGEEELHEDEEVKKLAKDEIIERTANTGEL
jgi:hypothetical protein